jgi:hypothetical protein
MITSSVLKTAITPAARYPIVPTIPQPDSHRGMSLAVYSR